MNINSRSLTTINTGTSGLLVVISIIVASSILLIAIWMAKQPIPCRTELTQAAIQTYSLLREAALNIRSQPPGQADPNRCMQKLHETLQLINRSLRQRGMHLTVESITVTQDLQATIEYTLWQGGSYVATTLTTGDGGYGVDLQPDTLQVDIPTRPYTVNLTFTIVNTGVRVESVRLTGDNVQAAYYHGQDPRIHVLGDSIIVEKIQPGEAVPGLILEFYVPHGLTTSIAEAEIQEAEISDYTLITWTQEEQWLNLTGSIDLEAGPQPTKWTRGSRGGFSNLIWDYQNWFGAWGGYVDPGGGYAEDWYSNLQPGEGGSNVYGSHGGQLYYDPTTQRWYEITDEGHVYAAMGEESGWVSSAQGSEVGRLVRVIYIPGVGTITVSWRSVAIPFIGSPVVEEVGLMAGYAYATYTLHVEDLEEAYLSLSLHANGTVKLYINGHEWSPAQQGQQGQAQQGPGRQGSNVTGLLHEGDNTITVVLLSSSWPGPSTPWTGSAQARGLLSLRVRASAASLAMDGSWESGVPLVRLYSLVGDAWMQYVGRTVVGGQYPNYLYMYYLRIRVMVRDLGSSTVRPRVYIRARGTVNTTSFSLYQDGPPGTWKEYMASIDPTGGDTITVVENLEVYVPSPSLDKIWYDTATASWSNT